MLFEPILVLYISLLLHVHDYSLSISVLFSMIFLSVGLQIFIVLYSYCDCIGYSIDPARTSLVFCKIKFYLTYIAAILPPSFMILACIDRWLLSSLDARARLRSQPRFAYRSMICVSLFWILFSIHSLFGSTISLRSGITQCYLQPGSYTLFIALYSIIINYLLPPTLMAIFGLLTIINIRQTQRQIHPMRRTGYIHRKDRHLLRMLLFQVLVNIICTIPGGAYQV